jgi:hypothetical protein
VRDGRRTARHQRDGDTVLAALVTPGALLSRFDGE